MTRECSLSSSESTGELKLSMGTLRPGCLPLAPAFLRDAFREPLTSSSYLPLTQVTLKPTAGVHAMLQQLDLPA